MNTNDKQAVHVVAGVITDSAGRVLIAQRPAGKHLAGGWEFPGGKLESGERPLDGLSRELCEELGIQIGPGPHRPLRKVRHAYSDRSIFIETWVIREYDGEPRGLDGQSLRWCVLDELAGVPLLPADASIVDSLRLPERLVSTSTDGYSVDARQPGKLMGVACDDPAQCLAAEKTGADFVILRRRPPTDILTHVCCQLLIPCYVAMASCAEAWSFGATGVHELP